MCLKGMRNTNTAKNRAQGEGGQLREVVRSPHRPTQKILLVTLVQYVDTAMVGSLGAVSTAAVAVNASPMWLLGGIMTSVGVGGMALASRFFGAGEYDDAERVCGQMATCALALSAFFMFVVWLIAGRLPAWMGAGSGSPAAFHRLYPHRSAWIHSQLSGNSCSPMRYAPSATCARPCC